MFIQATSHKKINFDEVELDGEGGYSPYPGNEDTGIIFKNTFAVDASVLLDYYEDYYADLIGFEMAATSKPNFGVPSNHKKPMKFLCRGGFFRLKSLRLTPVAQTFGRKIVSPRFAVMIKGVRNGKIVARKLVRLTLEDMNEAKEVTFDKKFDKGLTGVIFETFLLDPQSVNLYGVDDIKVKMLKRCAGLEEEKNSVSTSESSFEGPPSWMSAIVG